MKLGNNTEREHRSSHSCMPEFYFSDMMVGIGEIQGKPSEVGVVSGSICRMSVLTCLAFFFLNNSFIWDTIYIPYSSPIESVQFNGF